MTGTLTTDPAVLTTFDRVCASVCALGHGITTRQLGTAHALARALQSNDEERTAQLATALGIERCDECRNLQACVLALCTPWGPNWAFGLGVSRDCRTCLDTEPRTACRRRT